MKTSSLPLGCNRRPVQPQTDLTRGAAQFCIRRAAVSVETRILNDYAEIDPALGMNTAGVILTVLVCHIAMAPGGSAEDRITVCLQRRNDEHLVEVDLAIRRSRAAGGERLLLQFETEREFSPAPAESEA